MATCDISDKSCRHTILAALNQEFITNNSFQPIPRLFSLGRCAALLSLEFIVSDPTVNLEDSEWEAIIGSIYGDSNLWPKSGSENVDQSQNLRSLVFCHGLAVGRVLPHLWRYNRMTAKCLLNRLIESVKNVGPKACSRVIIVVRA